MKSIIMPEEAEEVRRLGLVYNEATREAAATFRQGGVGPSFTGERLQRFLEADGRAGAAMARIKEI